MRAFFLTTVVLLYEKLGLVVEKRGRAKLKLILLFHSIPYSFNYSMQSSQQKNIGKGYPTKGQLLNARSATDLCVDTNKSYINTVSSKNFQKYQVIVQNEHMESELKCIEWRSKTQFPIVKVLFYKILQKKLLNQCSVVQVAIQHFPYNLNTLPKMNFHHILYLLKESLIGYERLFDRFGPFDLTSKMVLINKNSKCRVWINENITLNFPSKRNKITEHQFLLKLVKIFEEKCIRTNPSAEFFHKILAKGQIVQALQFLEMFTKTNKIVIANRINLLNDANSPKKTLQKPQESNEKTDEMFCYNSLKKIPKFILELRQEKKIDEADSKSFDSPMARKKQVVKDRSFAKTAIIKEIKPKNQVQSQSKSNISPLSQLSQDIKQTKSNNQNTNKGKGKNYTPAVRELLKQNSQQNINTYATMRPIYTEKRIEHEEQLINRAISKHNSGKRTRKLSNQELSNQINKSILSNNNNLTAAIREECSILSSQQTATTINSSILNQNICSFMERAPQINIISPSQQPQAANIYQKNGWMKRLNSLTSQEQLRTTLHSHYQGQQTFSEDFLLAGQNLGLLGSMGKDLKGSIIGI